MTFLIDRSSSFLRLFSSICLFVFGSQTCGQQVDPLAIVALCLIQLVTEIGLVGKNHCYLDTYMGKMHWAVVADWTGAEAGRGDCYVGRCRRREPRHLRTAPVECWLSAPQRWGSSCPTPCRSHSLQVMAAHNHLHNYYWLKIQNLCQEFEYLGVKVDKSGR